MLKTGQARVELAHEGFRNIIYKNGKNIMSVVWEAPLNIYFISFLVFFVIEATEIHHL